eukprot:365048-Chlamydomonas_euryale.AAC.15
MLPTATRGVVKWRGHLSGLKLVPGAHAYDSMPLADVAPTATHTAAALHRSAKQTALLLGLHAAWRVYPVVCSHMVLASWLRALHSQR